jgi:hypothetical protein
MKTKELPTRKHSVKENIALFSKLTPSQKIRLLEKNRKALAYLRSLGERPGGDVNR